MTGDEVREATGESREGGTIQARLRRMFYMYVIRKGPVLAAGRAVTPADSQAYRTLFTLMTHPRGVDIVDALARSPQKGRDLLNGLANDSYNAIVALQGKLTSDESLIWRFPPAVTAGVAKLGLRNRPGITQFALAWGASRKSPLEEALEIAGNSLLVLDLVGGPIGAAVSDVLNFVIAVIGTAVSFLRDVEQDQAAASTAFAARSERLSTGSNKIGTVLQGVAAIAAGLAVPGAVSRITGRKVTAEAAHALGPTERVRPMKDLPDPRGVTSKKGTRDAVEEADRAIAAKGNKAALGKKAGRTSEEAASRAERSDPRGVASKVTKRDTVEEADKAIASKGTPSASEKPGSARSGARRAKEPAGLASKPKLPTGAKPKSPPKAKPKAKSSVAIANKAATSIGDRSVQFEKTLKSVEDELVTVLTDTKIGMSRSEAEKVAANLRQSLPKTPPTSIEELKKTIQGIMDAATRQAWSEGLTNEIGNRLGNRAHRYTEYLLDQLNVRLAKGKMRIGVFAEQFISDVDIFHSGAGQGWTLSKNEKGWLGIDAVLYQDGVPVFAIDLKTGKGWSKTQVQTLLQRFGLKDKDLLQYHPKLWE
jgi:hypothetical protein